MASLVDKYSKGDTELEEAILKCARATKGRKIKPLFQKFDDDGDAVLGSKEFTKLLQKLGVKLGHEPYRKLMAALDCDDDGVVAYKEFQAMIRSVEKEKDKQKKEVSQARKEQDRQLKELAKEQAKKLEQGRTRSVQSLRAAEDTVSSSSTKKKSPDKEGLEKLWRKIKKYVDLDGSDEDGVAAMTKMFETYDTNGDGELTLEELAEGLGKAGVKTTKKKFKALLAALDKGGDGKISLKEFVKGAKKGLEL